MKNSNTALFNFIIAVVVAAPACYKVYLAFNELKQSNIVDEVKETVAQVTEKPFNAVSEFVTASNPVESRNVTEIV